MASRVVAIPISRFTINAARRKASTIAAPSRKQSLPKRCAARVSWLIPIHSPKPAAWSLLGVVLLQQGKSEEAADAFRRSVELNANDALTWSNLGAVEWAQGRLNEADEAYAKSLAISRENLTILRNYARLLTEWQQPERALKLLEEVVNREPQNVMGWLLAGNAFQVLGDMDQAAAAYRQALAISPRDAAARYSYSLALLVVHDGSLAEA